MASHKWQKAVNPRRYWCSPSNFFTIGNSGLKSDDKSGREGEFDGSVIKCLNKKDSMRMQLIWNRLENLSKPDSH